MALPDVVRGGPTLERCPQCGYSLAHLPRDHACPECGLAYDRSMFLLAGWTVPRFGRAALAMLIVVLALLLARFTFAWPWMVVAGGAVACVVVDLALELYLRHRRGPGGRALVTYVVSEEGIGLVGRRLFPWRDYSHLMLLREGDTAWRLHLYPRLWTPGTLIGLSAPMINADLHCPEADAEAVRGEIQRRISAARRREAERRRA
jgi:hypothetical protein